MGPPARGGGPQNGASTYKKGTRIPHCGTSFHYAVRYRAQLTLVRHVATVVRIQHCGIVTTQQRDTKATHQCGAR